MAVILCPNCGKPLEYNDGSAQQFVKCPKCGVLPLFDDSQVITITEGKVGGPGLSNLQEQEEEWTIQRGKLIQPGESPHKKTEESIIGESREETIHVDSPSLNPVQNVVSNIPSSTVEEKIDVEWKAESKQVKSSLGPSSSKHSQNLRYTQRPRSAKKNFPPSLPTTQDRPKTQQQRLLQQKSVRQPVRRKIPWHYFGIFYGIPAILILILVFFTLHKCTRSSRQVVVHVGPQATWSRAEQAYQEGYVYYREAMECLAKQEKDKFYQKLQRADSFYRNALKLGKQSWEEHIADLMKQNNMSQEQANQYAFTHHGGYQQKMQKWQQEFRLIQQHLSDKPK